MYLLAYEAGKDIVPKRRHITFRRRELPRRKHTTSQRLLKGKFFSPYEDLKAHPQKFFFFNRYFRMSSATFDKLLVVLGPSLTLQDTTMRKPVPPEERLAVTLK
jgi:hypothetical protein